MACSNVHASMCVSHPCCRSIQAAVFDLSLPRIFYQAKDVCDGHACSDRQAMRNLRDLLHLPSGKESRIQRLKLHLRNSVDTDEICEASALCCGLADLYPSRFSAVPDAKASGVDSTQFFPREFGLSLYLARICEASAVR